MREITPAVTQAAVNELAAKAHGATGPQRMMWNVLQRAVRDLDGQQSLEGVAAAEFFTGGEYLRFAQAVGLSADDVMGVLRSNELL